MQEGGREGQRSGLRNIAERAERLGGALVITGSPEEGSGTRLEWRVPLPAPSR
ncbi:hypothetical protein [Streptomyces antarcticus]|uniref:hypothetical protein n=1 Tax=Streptomyces antarcticus TaxID=2996458 RepID=UPI003B82E310